MLEIHSRQENVSVRYLMNNLTLLIKKNRKLEDRFHIQEFVSHSSRSNSFNRALWLRARLI